MPVPGDPRGTDDLLAIQAENGPDRPLEVMSTAERHALFARLADKLHALAASQGPRRPAPRPPGRGTGEVRPECLIRLAWDGHTLERSLFLPGHDRWWSPDLRAPAALEWLDVWRPSDPFDGDLLFELLFGADSDLYQGLLADPWGEGSATPAAPTRWPWRIRLLLDAGSPLLHCLPWTLISHQGLPLRDSGWTVELAPSAVGRARPEWPNHAFIMPGCVLLCAPDAPHDRQAAAHLHDLRALLQQLRKRPPPIFEAADAAQLAAQLRDHSPRLVYYYGRVEPVGAAWRLCLPDGAGGTGLDLISLASLFSPVPPSALLLKLLEEEATAALPQTAPLARVGACKFVGVAVSPRADSARAQQAALAWFTGTWSAVTCNATGRVPVWPCPRPCGPGRSGAVMSNCSPYSPGPWTGSPAPSSAARLPAPSSRGAGSAWPHPARETCGSSRSSPWRPGMRPSRTSCGMIWWTSTTQSPAAPSTGGPRPSASRSWSP